MGIQNVPCVLQAKSPALKSKLCKREYEWRKKSALSDSNRKSLIVPVYYRAVAALM